MAFDKLMAQARRQFHVAQITGLLTHHRVNGRGLVSVRELDAVLEALGYTDGATDILEEITAFDVRQRRVPSTALVVDAETGRPWAGFFEQLSAAQVVVGDERTYWEEALAQLDVAPPRRPRQRTPSRKRPSRRAR